MANYKKIYDLEYTDVMLCSGVNVTRNIAKSRRYHKKQSNKAVRREVKKMTEIEVPVTKYEIKCTAKYHGNIVKQATFSAYYKEDIAMLTEEFEWSHLLCDITTNITIINVR